MTDSDNKIFERLEELDQLYKTISQQLVQSSTISNFELFRSLSQKKNKIKAKVLLYRDHLMLKNAINEYHILLKSEPELKSEIDIELARLSVKLKNKVKELKAILIPKDEQDNKNVILEIKGAAGGNEANIFAGNLYRMYQHYCDLKKWRIELINGITSDNGGFTNVVFKVKGQNVFAHLKYESGIHRVQRIPITDSKHRIHTSTVSVAVLPEIDNLTVELKSSDLKIDTYRSSGAGGQHVNTTDSAVRITHLPTGIIATSQDGRSQHSNKALALEHLRSKIYLELTARQKQKQDKIKKAIVGTGVRSEKIRTYNYPQNRITDHRIKLTLHNLNEIMDGKLDNLITILINFYQKKKIITIVDD